MDNCKWKGDNLVLCKWSKKCHDLKLDDENHLCIEGIRGLWHIKHCPYCGADIRKKGM